jgi:signal transduction histidine kinase
MSRPADYVGVALPLELSSARAERFVAAGRVWLAASTLVAIWIDSTRPIKDIWAAAPVLTVYVIYAVILAGETWLADAPRVRLRLATHIIDLAVFTVVMYLTEGPMNPFLALFVFAIVTGTVRWGAKGTLWTAVVAVAFLLALGIHFDLNHFIVRSVYLTVVAVLIGYLGEHERRIRREIARLAAWPVTMPRDGTALIGETLAYAAGTMDARRALLIWDDAEEPWRHVAFWSRDGLGWTREAPNVFEPLVAEPIQGLDFLCADAGAKVPRTFRIIQGIAGRWRGAPLHPDLCARFDIRSVVGLSLGAESVRGWLFFLDIESPSSDDLVLGKVVARQVAARMEQLRLLERLGTACETEARVDLARDLHDGLLQALTGAGLQIEVARGLMDTDPSAAIERLRDVQRLLAAEQRDLRTLLRDLKPIPEDVAPETTLEGRLEELCRRVERQWGLTVMLEAEPGLRRLPRELARDVQFMVHEAVINAARHGRADAVEVRVEARQGSLRLLVADNGRGLPFHGRREHAALSAAGSGPVTLWSRIDELGGTLAIDSSAQGVRLEIVLPLERAGVCHAA